MILKNILDKIKNLNSRLLNIEDKRIIKNGKRNTYYLIGKKALEYTGPGNAGTLTLFVDNIGEYQQSIPAYFMVNVSGQCFKHSIGVETKSIKSIITYKDDKYCYIFLYAPNYHDNFHVDLVSSYNITFDVQEMTSEEFNSFISGMTKVSQA